MLKKRSISSWLFNVHTVLANTICKEIKGLEWTKEHFPLHYEHKYMVAASTRTMLHVEPPRALDEKKTKDMIVLLEGLMERYLNLLSERLPEEDKEKFIRAKKHIEKQDCSLEDLRRNEEILCGYVAEQGELILHGDLLSIEAASTALRLRKSALTVLERLQFIKHLRIGDFHLEMSKTMKDLPALMPEITNTDDMGTLAYFLNYLGKTISNEPNQIKKAKNYGKFYGFNTYQRIMVLYMLNTQEAQVNKIVE